MSFFKSVIARMSIDITANTGKLDYVLDKAQVSLNKFKASSLQTSKIVGGTMAASFAVAGAAAYAASKQIGKMSDEADKIGVSSDYMSKLSAGLGAAGIQAKQVTASFEKMNETIRKSAVATSSQASAFSTLGISYEKLKGLNTEAQFESIINSLSKMEEGTLKASSANYIFGTSGRALLKELKDGSKSIQELTDKYGKLGHAISAVTEEQAKRFNKSIADAKAQFKGLVMTVGAQVLPVFDKLITTIPNLTGLARGFGTALGSVIGIAASLGTIIKNVFDVIGTVIGATVATVTQSIAYLDKKMNDIVASYAYLNSLITFGNQQAYWEGIMQDADKASAEAEASVQASKERIALIWSELPKDINGKIEDAIGSISGYMEAVLGEVDKTAKVAEASVGKTIDEIVGLKKAADSLVMSLKREHRPIQSMFEDWGKSIQLLEDVKPFWSKAEYEEGISLAKESGAKIVDAMMEEFNKVGDVINSIFGKALDDVEEIIEDIDFASMFDGFAAGLNPAIGALQSFKDELAIISELYEGGYLDKGQKTFYSTGLAAEFALSSMSQMAEQGSRAQKKLATAAAAVNTVLAITAILEQGKGDPYTAFARMAAMAALVASLGVQISGSFGGSGGSGGAEQQQRTQGTGTVLGDASAKSESINNALETIAKASDKIVGINSKMLRSLESMKDAIAGTITQMGRLGGIGDMGTKASGFGGLIGAIDSIIFGKSKVIDRGIQILAGGISQAIDGTLFEAYEVARKKGLFGSSTRTNSEALGDGISNQIGLIFESMTDAILAGAESIGVNMLKVQSALSKYRIEEQRISLLDLSPDEQRTELEAVFSSIFDGLVNVSIPFITQFQKAGEGLGETLARVSTTVLVFEEAVESMGLEFIQKQIDPELFAQAAVAIADFAGGIESFIDGYSTYISKFLSENEQLEILAGRIGGVFDGLGLALPDTREGFTQLIQSLDLTTESGQMAFGMLIALSGEMDSYYNSLERQEAERARLEQERIEQMNDARIAVEEYIQTMAEHRSELNRTVDMYLVAETEYDNMILRYEEATAAARELGLSQQVLSQIQRQFAFESEQLIIKTKLSILRNARDLFGNNDVTSEMSSGFSNVSKQVNGLFAAWEKAIKSLKEFSNSLLLNEQLTTLTPFQRFIESQSQFWDTYDRAMGGDVDAANSLPDMAKEFLTAARFVFASSDDYSEIFDSVLSAINNVEMPSNIPEIIMESTNSAINAATNSVQTSVADNLITELERILAATELAQELAYLSDVMNTSVFELAETLGIPLDELVKVFGVEISNMTDGMVNSLVGIAEVLGVSVLELSDSLGLGLDDLLSTFGMTVDELKDATVDTLQEVADSLGIDLSALASALGISVEGVANSVDSFETSMTYAQQQAISGLSRALGISVDDLTSIFDSTGDLLSMTVDDLARTLGISVDDIPEGLRSSLGSLLGNTATESTAGDRIITSAIQTMDNSLTMSTDKMTTRITDVYNVVDSQSRTLNDMRIYLSRIADNTINRPAAQPPIPPPSGVQSFGNLSVPLNDAEDETNKELIRKITQLNDNIVGLRNEEKESGRGIQRELSTLAREMSRA